MKFVFVLIGAGLVGSVLNSVLKRVVKKYLKKYITPRLKETVYQLDQDRKAEEEQNNRIEKDDTVDTVIVPIKTGSEKQVKKDREYRCPSDYSFKADLKYIAFYKEKKIIGYGKIISNYQPVGDVRIFEIDSFIEREIPRKRKGAFIQNKKYCTLKSLLDAKTTDDIKP